MQAPINGVTIGLENELKLSPLLYTKAFIVNEVHKIMLKRNFPNIWLFGIKYKETSESLENVYIYDDELENWTTEHFVLIPRFSLTTNCCRKLP